MVITKPSYYDAFRCIAGACPDSCCKEWDVQVDADAAAYYRSLPGELGDRLRQVLTDEDGETVMTIVDGRCPMWRQDGLCRIQAELGEEALCDVCREFPRLRHDYGDFMELGLELSCPEAAKFILNTPAAPRVEEQVPGGEPPEYDADAMEVLKRTREFALSLLQKSDRPERLLAGLLLYGHYAQDLLDGAEEDSFDAEAALDAVQEFIGKPEDAAFRDFFRELEILTEQWPALLDGFTPRPLPEKTLALARYLIERYWLQAVADYDLVGRVKLIVISCILVGYVGGDYEQTTQLFSKEIENDADNIDAILEAAYTCSAFTDSCLLGMLLRENEF